MIRWLRHLFGYVEVEEPAHYGHPWPPATRWVKRKDIPPWGLEHYGRPDRCQVRMRAPGGISMWNGCDLDVGHEGVHRWSIDVRATGEHFEGTFTTEAAVASWGRHASVEELEAYEAGELPGVTWRRV